MSLYKTKDYTKPDVTRESKENLLKSKINLFKLKEEMKKLKIE